MTAPHPVVLMPVARKANSSADRCPWCDQPITHDKFEEIHARIAAQERERTAQFERRLTERVAQAYGVYAVVAVTLILVLHRGNIARLLAGTEPKLGQGGQKRSGAKV